jgi:anhydro-N-acetylmuramic acid kinase
MNRNIQKLYLIAAKKKRTIIGLMSGTSLDGLDVALCEFSGSGLQTKVAVNKFATVPYTKKTKDKILKVFARHQVNFEELCLLNPYIGMLHGEMVLNCLRRWCFPASKVDIIASHGQTVFHSPSFLHPKEKINGTLQIGDGDHIAVKTGIITISDFRQKHIAAGGEGAPLAVYGDYLLFSKKDSNRILLNMGGIGNFTFLPAGAKADKVFVTDTGPSNTLLDQVIRDRMLGQYFDKDAAVASRGSVYQSLLASLKSDPFFSRSFPKTIGPELFNLDFVHKHQVKTNTQSLPIEDLMATLTRLSAETMAEAIQRVVSKKYIYEIYLSGGGAHNPLLVNWLKELLPNFTFQSIDVLGISGDAKEAVLFAVLANEALSGGKINFGNRSNLPSVSMGKVSFPD